jgi:hypothetical protein
MSFSSLRHASAVPLRRAKLRNCASRRKLSEDHKRARKHNNSRAQKIDRLDPMSFDEFFKIARQKPNELTNFNVWNPAAAYPSIKRAFCDVVIPNNIFFAQEFFVHALGGMSKTLLAGSGAIENQAAASCSSASSR